MFNSADHYLTCYNFSGGGNIENPKMDRSYPPLRWMSYEATAAGLRLNPFGREWNMKPDIIFHESLTLPWYILEYLRLTHPTYDGEKTKARWYVDRYLLRSDNRTHFWGN